MIYKFIKCESVIAKIMSDADMQEKDLRVTDIREWIFEAIEKIGAPLLYIQKLSGEDGVPVFKLEDGLIPIPEELASLTTVAYSKSPNGPFVPIRSSSNQISRYDKKRKHHRDVFHEKTFSYKKDDKHFPEKPITAMCQAYGVNLCKYYDKEVGTMMEDDVTFFIKPGWIVLNKKDGFVKISYKSIAVDERGYPLIPDLASYQEAIYWYVMMKMSFPKFLSGKLGGKPNLSYQTYAFLQQQWNFYRNQAYAESIMPNESDMRSIKNEWNKLIPEWDDDEIFYRNLGRKLLNYNDYYYGY